MFRYFLTLHLHFTYEMESLSHLGGVLWVMSSRIGSSLLNRLKPDEKPYEYRDNSLKGFMVRVQPSGVMTY